MLTGLTLALVGLLAWESAAVAWTAVALTAVIAVFGTALDWPAWLTDVSPFTQTSAPRFAWCSPSATPCSLGVLLA